MLFSSLQILWLVSCMCNLRVWVSVKQCVCVFFNFDCSNAELLSLHWSSPHTWHFWGCRWRLSTRVSLYFTHPFCLNFSLTLSPHYLAPPPLFVDYSSESFCFFQHPDCFFVVVVVLTFCSRMSKLSSGIACFRPLSCQLPTMLSSVFFFVCFFELCPFSVGTSPPFLMFSVDHSLSPSGTCNVT